MLYERRHCLCLCGKVSHSFFFPADCLQTVCGPHAVLQQKSVLTLNLPLRLRPSSRCQVYIHCGVTSDYFAETHLPLILQQLLGELLCGQAHLILRSTAKQPWSVGVPLEILGPWPRPIQSCSKYFGASSSLVYGTPDNPRWAPSLNPASLYHYQECGAVVA